MSWKIAAAINMNKMWEIDEPVLPGRFKRTPCSPVLPQSGTMRVWFPHNALCMETRSTEKSRSRFFFNVQPRETPLLIGGVKFGLAQQLQSRSLSLDYIQPFLPASHTTPT